ncbi:hypothetical protein CY35_02G168200 [Sphagnum magellanicum]|nr:hypothetical protein CY35_02G168200 [Sphagnum magellanicum]KAH9572750.1 hypothetical protein CY35_02G168200 [Sphagnum magellanicum]
MRNILLPLFHSEQMESFLPLLARILNNLTKNLSCCCHRDKDVNISDLLHKFALDVIGESAFGTRFNLLEDEKISHLKHGGHHDLAAAVTPTPGTVVNPDQELVNQAVKSLNALRMDSGAPASTIAGILYPILQHPLRFFLTKIPGTADWVQETSNRKLVERLNNLQARRKREVDDDDDHKITRIDALSLLLTACQANAASRNLLQDNFVSGLTYELLLAGSETTATTLSFAIYNISGSERVEEKLLQEIDAYGPIDSKVGLEDLDKKFPYVEQVLKETMRMYTTTPVVARELSEQLEIGGYLLPKGTAIWMAMIAIFKDPKNFPEPEEFRPERFDPDSQENRNRPPYSYFPFGIGPRTCIGYKFAMMEAKMALIQIYRHFRLRRSPLMEHPLALQFGMIVRPKNGVIVHVQHRQTDSPEQSQIHW